MIPEDLVLLDRSPAITIRKRAVSGESADTLMASSSTLYVKHDIFRNAYEGNSRIVLAMLDKEPRLIDEIGELNNQTCYAPSTVLHFACRGGHISLAYELVRVHFLFIYSTDQLI